jgi:CpeT protein
MGDLMTLAQWIAGDFSNQKQAIADPRRFSHIHIFFRPLPYAFFSGIGFYSEQAHDYDLWAPYRQGVHRLVDQGEQIYIENYGFKDGLPFAGGGRCPDLLKAITHESIEPRRGCAMVFKRSGDRFIGGVEPGNACLIPKNGRLTYLDSYVELTATTWLSLDQGKDLETHEQVWGSQEGHLQFEKVTNFADELPAIP